MKNKKRIIIFTTILFVLISLISSYICLIQGEKLSEADTDWIKRPIAHRGLHSDDVPENSIESFKQAIGKNYIIELDVQLTQDNQLVVFHDSNLERMTTDKRNIKDVTYEEIKDLKLKNTNETIPTLEKVLKIVDNQVPLLIEIKNGENAKELAKETYNIIKDYNGRYIIQSFNPLILEWFKEKNPEILRCQLSCDFEGEQNADLKWYEKFVLKNLLLNFKSKPHIIAYDLNAIDNLSVKLLKEKYPIISWTIKNEEQMKLGYEKSDNIIFDNIRP